MTYDFTVFRGSSTGEIHQSQTQRPKVPRDEAFIDVTHSGVCGTDEHFKWVDMGLGHEGVGIVKEVGPEVKTLKM
jgi:D-arabinose 1-dehydrogenase-like Zn-dependent alcohol dehydrogenase